MITLIPTHNEPEQITTRVLKNLGGMTNHFIQLTQRLISALGRKKVAVGTRDLGLGKVLSELHSRTCIREHPCASLSNNKHSHGVRL